MEWNKKTEMIKLANAQVDHETRSKFFDYVKQNVQEFDLQAWEMFLTAIQLIPSELEQHKDFLQFMHPISIASKVDDELSWRSAMRFEVFKEICSTSFVETKPQTHEQ